MKSEREAVRRKFGPLFDEVTEILFRHDPMGINYGRNNAYEPEVSTILPRLESVVSGEDALRMVHEEFVGWFSRGTAGPPERYASAAAEIWTVWQRFKEGA